MAEDTSEVRAVGVALGIVLGHTFKSLGDDPEPGPSTMMTAREVVDELGRRGFVVLADSADHYVTFDERGWFVEHSIACRRAGTLGTCEYNSAVREIADEPDPEQFGRWCITGIDSEGLPSLERVDG